jgi:hypothetical protein
MKAMRFMATMMAIAISAAASIDTIAQRNDHRTSSRNNHKVERPMHKNDSFKGDKGGKHTKPQYHAGAKDNHFKGDKGGKHVKPMHHAGPVGHGHIHHGKAPHKKVHHNVVPRHPKMIHVAKPHHHHSVRPGCCDFKHWKKHRPMRGTVVHHLPPQHTVVIRDGRPFYSALGVLLAQVLVDGVISYMVVD